MMNQNMNASENFRDTQGPRGPRNPNYQQGNYQGNNPRNFNEGSGNMGGGNTGFGTQHGNYGKGFNQPGNNPTMAPKGDEFTSKFCMSYQFNQPCRYE